MYLDARIGFKFLSALADYLFPDWRNDINAIINQLYLCGGCFHPRNGLLLFELMEKIDNRYTLKAVGNIYSNRETETGTKWARGWLTGPGQCYTKGEKQHRDNLPQGCGCQCCLEVRVLL